MTELLLPSDAVTIRRAFPEDAPALARLASLDSARRPLDGAMLLAERDGRVLAAISLADGRHVADPFAATADLVSLLRMRAAAMLGRPSRRERVVGPILRRRPAVARG
ncbi:MAG: hypothetical protein HZB46_11055 [Solirubrobacterales bacterium]|nr:hypothetical protein [Solirubrobacterales bacterium]